MDNLASTSEQRSPEKGRLELMKSALTAKAAKVVIELNVVYHV